MERQIKFRAWIEKDKSMISHREVIERAHLQFEGKLNHNDIVMQFTGLQDKNGEDIYEGDILSFETDPKGVVRWNNHVLCYTYYEEYTEKEMKNSDFLWDWGQLKEVDCMHYIVHGNIYENPELLNSQK